MHQVSGGWDGRLLGQTRFTGSPIRVHRSTPRGQTRIGSKWGKCLGTGDCRPAKLSAILRHIETLKVTEPTHECETRE
jgi:hypothetical protein